MNQEFYIELAKRFTTPVQLYHGTSSKFIPSILKYGLKGDNQNSVWKDHNTRPDRFHITGRGRGPTFPGVYAANKVVGARQYAGEATHKHGGNHTYVEIQSHNRQLHPDDDALAHALVRAHENSPYSKNLLRTLKYLTKKERKEGLGKKLIQQSQKDFADKAIEHLGLSHKSPESLEKMRPTLNKLHNSGQRLHHLDNLQEELRSKASFKDRGEEKDTLRQKAQSKVDSLMREHEGKYRAAMKELSDHLTWDKHHDTESGIDPKLTPHRIPRSVGYSGRTRITGVHELEPDKENQGENWIKTHYSEHKDADGNMTPSLGFINSIHRAGYTVKGVKNKHGKVITEF